MRLIDADELAEKMKSRMWMVGRASDAVCLIEDAPTVDAVPVVRCKDCKYWHMMSYRTERLCYHLGHSTDKDWFCPCGRIKEQKDETD